jgi:hypothetical protein
MKPVSSKGHQVDITEKEESEVVEEFGGPYRGQTYDPLMKSPAEGLTLNTQDDLSPSNNEDEA